MITKVKFKRIELNSGFHVVGVKLFYVKTSEKNAHSNEYGEVFVDRNTLCEVDSARVKPWWKLW